LTDKTLDDQATASWHSRVKTRGGGFWCGRLAAMAGTGSGAAERGPRGRRSSPLRRARVPRAPVSLEPAGQPAHGALRPQGATMDRGDPGGEPACASREAAHHQPGQGLQRPPIQPLCLWASHLHQRLREPRWAVQVSPPGTTVIPTRGSPDLRRAGGHASLLSVNQPVGL
jgi:hypothetical protein